MPWKRFKFHPGYSAIPETLRFRAIQFTTFKPCGIILVKSHPEVKPEGYTLECEEVELPEIDYDEPMVQCLSYTVKESFVEEGILLPDNFEIIDVIDYDSHGIFEGRMIPPITWHAEVLVD